MRIAFIAMSGVRAWSKEITEAGLTMPGFIERSQSHRLTAQPRHC